MFKFLRKLWKYFFKKDKPKSLDINQILIPVPVPEVYTGPTAKKGFIFEYKSYYTGKTKKQILELYKFWGRTEIGYSGKHKGFFSKRLI